MSEAVSAEIMSAILRWEVLRHFLSHPLPTTHNHHCAVSFSSVGRLSRATWRVSHHWGNYVKLFFFLLNNMFATCFISTPSDFLMVFDPSCDPWTSVSSSQPFLDSANDFSFWGKREVQHAAIEFPCFLHMSICNWWVTGFCTFRTDIGVDNVDGGRYVGGTVWSHGHYWTAKWSVTFIDNSLATIPAWSSPHHSNLVNATLFVSFYCSTLTAYCTLKWFISLHERVLQRKSPN